MRRGLWVSCVIAVLALAAVVPARAQAAKFELAGGPRYPLLSQRTYISQSLGWALKAGYHVSPRFTISGMYESQDTDSDVPNYTPESTVKIQLYGLGVMYQMTTEGDFQIYAVANVGKGKLTFDSPIAPPEGKVNGTDINLWYEAGVGTQFNLGARWAARLQVTARQTSPADSSVVMSGTRFSWVPAMDIVFRF